LYLLVVHNRFIGILLDLVVGTPFMVKGITQIG